MNTMASRIRRLEKGTRTQAELPMLVLGVDDQGERCHGTGEVIDDNELFVLRQRWWLWLLPDDLRHY